VARREANELGATPMNPLSHPMGEGQGEGLAVPIQLHEEDKTVILTLNPSPLGWERGGLSLASSSRGRRRRYG